MALHGAPRKVQVSSCDPEGPSWFDSHPLLQTHFSLSVWHSALQPDYTQFLKPYACTRPCPLLCSSFCLPCSASLSASWTNIHPSRPVPNAASFPNVLMTTHLHCQQLITPSAQFHKALYFPTAFACNCDDLCMWPTQPPNLAVNSSRAGNMPVLAESLITQHRAWPWGGS